MKEAQSDLAPQEAKVYAPIDSGSGAVFGDYFANMVWVGVAGDLTLVINDGKDVNSTTTLLFGNAAAGRWHYVPSFIRINSTGTTATEVVVGRSYSR